MIIGDKHIAKKVKKYFDHDDVIIFDVFSYDSKGENVIQYEEEKEQVLNILLENNDSSLFVYFSTCSVYDENEINMPYVQHKLNIENLIKDKSNNYLIIRKSQLVGGTEDKTSIVNFLVDCIANGKKFNLWKNTFRNIMDIEDFCSIASRAIKDKTFRNSIINIANPKNISVIEIVDNIEKYLGRKGQYDLLDMGTQYNIDIKKIEFFLNYSSICFEKDYFLNILKKYFKTSI